ESVSARHSGGREIAVNAKQNLPAIVIPRDRPGGTLPPQSVGDAADVGLLRIEEMGNSTILVTNVRKPLRLTISGVDVTIGIRATPTKPSVLERLRRGAASVAASCPAVYRRKKRKKAVTVNVDVTEDANVRDVTAIRDCTPPITRTKVEHLHGHSGRELWRTAVDEPTSRPSAGIDQT